MGLGVSFIDGEMAGGAAECKVDVRRLARMAGAGNPALIHLARGQISDIVRPLRSRSMPDL
ncbi:MAG: hypothetical protein APF78_04800 [Sphingomonadales bacterium BRH_c3]|nr:MAG: hypothetical protein APF78_04800 [Sphingomonadales bacterium BRH_c3]